MTDLPFALTTKWYHRPQVPHYHILPKAIDANLRSRRKLIEQAGGDRGLQSELRQMCAQDLLFWMNAFVWTFNPKNKGHVPKVLPFVTYPFQDDALMYMNSAIGDHDVRITKSRDMGASWMLISLFTWRWLFKPMESFLLVSRKEEYVDQGGNPKTLFWKIRFILKNLPAWMRPNYSDNSMALHNQDIGSAIDGESTNKHVGTGDRRTAVGLDEFAKVENQLSVLAAIQDVTDSCFYNSTHAGAMTEFAKLDCPTMELHWSMHPIKARGLYRVYENGRVEILDKEYWTAERIKAYEFVKEKPKNAKYNYRSPWYDYQCKRRKHAQLIAQELDIDALGAAFGFFDASVINEHKAKYCLLPFHVGDLDFEKATLENPSFAEVEGGPFRLWFNPVNGKPDPARSYIVGGDISLGTGASNSCLSVCDRNTGEKVAEYTTTTTRPEKFAEIAVALCRWFYGAFLIWEANGSGRTFGSRVLEAGYGNIFFKQVERSITKKVTEFPGWYSTPDDKRELLEQYRAALADGKYVNRSIEALEECRMYVTLPNGNPEHSAAADDSDPTGARANHGDRVIADALTVRGMREISPKKHVESKDIKPYTFAWRREQRKLEEQAARSDF